MKKRAVERREQILKAAFHAVADKGFEAVTLQDIADYAGVSKGVTNYYFQNKEDVFSSLLEWVTEQIYKNECQAINDQSTAIKKLEAYIQSVFISPEKNRKFYKVYLDFIAQASRNEQYQQINLQFYENCWGLGREIVSLGQEEGVFSQEIEIYQASKIIRAIIDGTLIQWLMCNRDDLHDFYKTNCFETIITFLKYHEA
ncbi:TetR/AcrR family transcriptional regulator [Alkalihalobacterium elongatum]|uniref:TetR/AcrR family transcriptional regulator n=1 Tax=Alkalihalobacterium elongatum TaxID=2675466 RepID=UPI001C1FE316|nr:TetR/AcrR family transcriptional regulator [Alkalihalobacterium elongatum]